MDEQLIFLPDVAEDIFLHIHPAQNFNGNVFLFLNPLLDEKNRSQSFQAQTARELCAKGYTVIRFDYFGTGDSKGECYELEEATLLKDLELIHKYIHTRFADPVIHLLGIRFGADLAIKWSIKKNEIIHLHLIEPLFLGSKFLIEQRTRRKMFHKINKMHAAPEIVLLNGHNYEDFQGYLLSDSMLLYLKELNSINSRLNQKKIHLYKLDNLFSRKNYQAFLSSHTELNTITSYDVNVASFWERLEATNTMSLTKEILTTL